VGGWLLAGGLTAGVTAGELYCFARCGTAGKISLGAVDAATLLLGYLFWRVVTGMNN